MAAQTGPIMVGDRVVGTITFGLEEEVDQATQISYAPPEDFSISTEAPRAFGVPSYDGPANSPVERHGPVYHGGAHARSFDGPGAPEKHGLTFRPGITTRGGAAPAAPPKITLDDVKNAVNGTVKGGIDRSKFRPEIAGNDALMKRAAAMVIGEVGADAPDKAKTVQLETAFNRAQYRGHSLDQALWDTANHGESGYYPLKTFNRGYAYLSEHPEWFENFKSNVWNKVLSGSNQSDIGYGPMTGNASAGVAANQFARGTPGYHLPGGDTYFREGPFTNELPRLNGRPIPVTRLGAAQTPPSNNGIAPINTRGSANLFSSGRASGMGIDGGIGQNLTSIKTNSGKELTVNAEAAPYFKSFLDDLESSGYQINSIGGFSPRQKRGGGGWSEHAFGNAIDINPDQNPWHTSTTNLPSNISDIAAKHGLTWGGDWRPSQRDPMHFEWTGARSTPSNSTAEK